MLLSHLFHFCAKTKTKKVMAVQAKTQVFDTVAFLPLYCAKTATAVAVVGEKLLKTAVVGQKE